MRRIDDDLKTRWCDVGRVAIVVMGSKNRGESAGLGMR